MGRKPLTQGLVKKALVQLGDKKGSSINAIHKYLLQQKGVSTPAPTKAQVGQVLQRACLKKKGAGGGGSAGGGAIQPTGDPANNGFRFRLNVRNLRDSAPAKGAKTKGVSRTARGRKPRDSRKRSARGRRTRCAKRGARRGRRGRHPARGRHGQKRRPKPKKKRNHKRKSRK
jgi:hypothetical protein